MRSLGRGRFFTPVFGDRPFYWRSRLPEIILLRGTHGGWFWGNETDFIAILELSGAEDLPPDQAGPPETKLCWLALIAKGKRGQYHISSDVIEVNRVIRGWFIEHFPLDSDQNREWRALDWSQTHLG